MLSFIVLLCGSCTKNLDSENKKVDLQVNLKKSFDGQYSQNEEWIACKLFEEYKDSKKVYYVFGYMQNNQFHHKCDDGLGYQITTIKCDPQFYYTWPHIGGNAVFEELKEGKLYIRPLAPDWDKNKKIFELRIFCTQKMI